MGFVGLPGNRNTVVNGELVKICQHRYGHARGKPVPSRLEAGSSLAVDSNGGFFRLYKELPLPGDAELVVRFLRELFFPNLYRRLFVDFPQIERLTKVVLNVPS